MQLKRQLMILAAMAGTSLAWVSTVSASVITNDAATDLLANPTSNPNGVWTYGGFSAASPTVTGATGTFNAFGPSQQHSDWAPGFNGWAAGPAIDVPAIEVNTSGVPNSPCCGVTPIGPGAIFMHPGPSTGPQDDVAIQWTAPGNGTVDVTASYIQRHTNAQLAEVAVNGVIVFAANASTVPGGTPFSTTGLPVLAGDTIDFIVNNANGYGAGSTQVGATIDFTAVPEPASLGLLGLGGLGLLARRRTA